MAPNNKPSLSLVFPVHNEEYIIEKTIKAYYKELNGKMDFEVIVAEDGSTDKTKEILKRVFDEIPIRLYMTNERKGYLGAIIDSLKHPKADWIFLVDSDHQFDPNDFWKLWANKDNYDIVLGRKIKRKDGFHRLILSRGFNLILRVLFKAPFWDMDTGFRLINKKCLDKELAKIHCLKFFTSELVVRAYNDNFRIKEVPVNHVKRKGSKTSIFRIHKLPFIVAGELVGLAKLFFEMKNGK